MVHERELLSCLSRLRRYAQALCGARSTGDDLLMTTIRRVDLRDPSACANLPVTLFRLLNKTWNEFEHIQVGSPFHEPNGDLENSLVKVEAFRTDAKQVDKRLDGVKSNALQAFLLVAQEGFPQSQAAEILEVAEDEFEELYSGAEYIILKRGSIDVLIIEDDTFVSADLGQIMTSMGHGIAGIASTCEQAIYIASKHQPGLILCDISLADGSSGICAVNEILDSKSVPVLFITSHADRLSTCNASEPAYLVSKPYSVEQIRTVSSQVLFHQQSHLTKYQDNTAA